MHLYIHIYIYNNSNGNSNSNPCSRGVRRRGPGAPEGLRQKPSDSSSSSTK